MAFLCLHLLQTASFNAARLPAIRARGPCTHIPTVQVWSKSNSSFTFRQPKAELICSSASPSSLLTLPSGHQPTTVIFCLLVFHSEIRLTAIVQWRQSYIYSYTIAIEPPGGGARTCTQPRKRKDIAVYSTK